MPIDTLRLPFCRTRRSPPRWRDAARAIMTTDTHSRYAVIAARLLAMRATLTGDGICKAGHDHAQLTMIAVITTDAPSSRRRSTPATLDRQTDLQQGNGRFHTSTNDTCIMLASGAAAGRAYRRGLRCL
ncbi:MAG: bifunctional ornithine acetyltransferase/N-acetylglutamate synthase [Collinsella sp.]